MVEGHYGFYPTRTRKKWTRLIPTLKGKTNYSGHIHLDIDGTTLNMTDMEMESHIIYIIMTQYALKICLINFK